MTDDRDPSDGAAPMTPAPADTFGQGSRVEAAEAGAHHEVAEQGAGVPPREHVAPSPLIHHHHPEDPNIGVVRGRLGARAALAGALAASVTLAGVVLLALAIGGGR